MKFAIWVLTFLIPMVSYAQPIDQGDREKIYVQPDQIVILSKGIFAYIQGDWTPVESISIDSFGVYAKRSNPDLRPWWCPNCNFCNSYWEKYCQNLIGNELCLTPRPKR